MLNIEFGFLTSHKSVKIIDIKLVESIQGSNK